MPTRGSYWKLIEPLFSTINLGSGAEGLSATIVDVPHPRLLLFAAHMCLAEVHNGGFLQLFWNNTGVLVPEGVEGFKEIGMRNMAALVREAALPLGSPFPRDRDDRWNALLVASGRSTDEIEAIFRKHDNPYLAFEEATKTLRFDVLDKQFWKAAKTENGGFQEAADRYAQSVRRVH